MILKGKVKSPIELMDDGTFIGDSRNGVPVTASFCMQQQAGSPSVTLHRAEGVTVFSHHTAITVQV